MAAVQLAERRLDEAMARLEHVLLGKAAAFDAARTAQEGETPAAQIAVLRRECATLRASLDEAGRARARALEVAGVVAGRLDRAIGEIDRLTGG